MPDLSRAAAGLRIAPAEDLPGAARLLQAEGIRGWTVDVLAEAPARADRKVWTYGQLGSPFGVAIGQWLLEDAELLAVAVAPGLRRQGVGRALVDAVAVAAQAAGARRLHLEVRATNRPAIALYSGLGFERVGHRPGFYGDADATLMKLELRDPSSAAAFSPERR